MKVELIRHYLEKEGKAFNAYHIRRHFGFSSQEWRGIRPVLEFCEGVSYKGERRGRVYYAEGVVPPESLDTIAHKMYEALSNSEGYISFREMAIRAGYEWNLDISEKRPNIIRLFRLDYPDMRIDDSRKRWFIEGNHEEIVRCRHCGMIP